YRYTHSFANDIALDVLLRRFFAHARLPEQLESPMADGESIALSYGGYLRLAASASAGTEAEATLLAGVAGHFSIALKPAQDQPGWVRVLVRRQRGAAIGVAADVKVEASSEDAAEVWNMALHAGYSRSTMQDALLDICLSLTTAHGRQAMAAAGRGDFVPALCNADPDAVRLNAGVFARCTQAQSRWKIVLGGFRREAMDGVCTSMEQQIGDGFTVQSTAELKLDRLRDRQQEATKVAFLLRAIGQSKGVLKGTGAEFPIEQLTALTARYDVGFADHDTTAEELAGYLDFARELGLDRYGATFENIAPLLPRTATGSYGPIVMTYEVRFGAKAVAALLSLDGLSSEHEAVLRRALRSQVVRNYERGGSLRAVAQAYASPAIYAEYRSSGFAVFSRKHGHLLTTLYSIEDALVDAIRKLYEVLGSKKPITPRQFEKRLAKFGKALQLYDRFDQTSAGAGTNSIFFVFDTLIRLAAREEPANIGILRLRAGTGEHAREMAFLTPEAAILATC
ncbi:MAG: hypothetical protein JNK87_10605, partial [Bryobacterales bacterium]|nr:hypothetical protein [Bryobacterales bacterium]